MFIEKQSMNLSSMSYLLDQMEDIPKHPNRGLPCPEIENDTHPEYDKTIFEEAYSTLTIPHLGLELGFGYCIEEEHQYCFKGKYPKLEFEEDMVSRKRCEEILNKIYAKKLSHMDMSFTIFGTYLPTKTAKPGRVIAKKNIVIFRNDQAPKIPEEPKETKKAFNKKPLKYLYTKRNPNHDNLYETSLDVFKTIMLRNFLIDSNHIDKLVTIIQHIPWLRITYHDVIKYDPKTDEFSSYECRFTIIDDPTVLIHTKKIIGTEKWKVRDFIIAKMLGDDEDA